MGDIQKWLSALREPRVSLLKKRTQSSTSGSDAIEAATYLRLRVQCRNGGDYQRLFGLFERISRGCRHSWLYADPSRWQIEARILTIELTSSLSRKSRVARGIAKFEALFFGLLDHLHDQAPITSYGIGPTTRNGLIAKDVGVMWRYFGYRDGASVVKFSAYDFQTNKSEDCPYVIDGLVPNPNGSPLEYALDLAIRVRLYRSRCPREWTWMVKVMHELTAIRSQAERGKKEAKRLDNLGFGRFKQAKVPIGPAEMPVPANSGCPATGGIPV